MQKAIEVKDLDTGTVNWESLPDFHRKRGGDGQHKKFFADLKLRVTENADLAEVKAVLVDLLTFMEKV